MGTRVVNLRNEAHDVYIGRAGRGENGYFGNPYVVGHRCPRCKKPHPTPGSTIPCFEAYFFDRVARDEEFLRKVLDLRGKTLGCFCKPAPCHGDVIARFLEGA